MEMEKKRFENLSEVGYEARKEVEAFLNRWLNDSTKGWAVRSDLVNCCEDHSSTPIALYLN